MAAIHNHFYKKRICPFCDEPLDPNAHGNQKMHPDCAYKWKKNRQKVTYRVGNSAKLTIQKNERIAKKLYQMDKQKKGIPHLSVMEEGFNFNCPVSKRDSVFGVIRMMDQFGYIIKNMNGETVIIFYHESEIL